MKKYSEEFINNSDILKTAIIGFEFEFYVKEMSFFKTLEVLNTYLKPVEVYGFKQYHPEFTPTQDKFFISPDLSGGSSMVELVTGPMSYHLAKYYLVKILKFIQDYCYTNEKASIHFNISFEDKKLSDLNVLKLILNIDEDDVYRVFPSRKNNVYSKSVKKIIPFRSYDFDDISIDTVKNNIRIPEDKYYGINFLHINKDKTEQRIEYRYVGGKDYEKNVGDLIYFMDKFILITHKCIHAGFNQNDADNLGYYLDKNITNFKNFSNYDNFLIQFPTITLQVDAVSDYDVVNAYYNSFFDKLYTIIDSTDSLKDCILNWIPEQQKLEIVDASVKCTANISEFDFINCVLEGIFEHCFIVNCKINNSQLAICDINGCEIKGSKVLNCTTENSELLNCFLQSGYFNGRMEGGVFRGGTLGRTAYISSSTKVVTGDDNFFGTNFDADEFNKKTKGFKK